MRDKQILTKIYQETIEHWNKLADGYNQWDVLCWEEKSNRLLNHVSKEEIRFISAHWEDIEEDALMKIRDGRNA